MRLEMDPPAVTSWVRFTADVAVVVPTGVALTISNGEGNIEVHHNTEDTAITVANGNVDVFDHETGALAIQAQNGDISVDSTGGDVFVTLTNGSVGINATPPNNGQVVVTGVTLSFVGIAVPADFAGIVDLDTSAGVIMAFLDSFTGFDEANMTQSETSLTVTLGEESSRVDVNILTGSITFQELQ